jgi:glutamate synthase (NADPH/NADH) large chain
MKLEEKLKTEAIKDQIEGLYISSLSSKSIIYKGMFLAESIADFYVDLKG